MFPKRVFNSISRHSNPSRCLVLGSCSASRLQSNLSSLNELSSTVIKTLPNGLRIVAMPSPGHFSSIGIYIGTGSRFEMDDHFVQGTSTVIDRMAFKSTLKTPASQLVPILENLGGNVMSSSSRESICYQASALNKDLSKLTDTLSEMVTQPAFLKEDLQDTLDTLAWEIQSRSYEPQEFLVDELHQLAYGKKDGSSWNSLGRPLFPSLDSLSKFTPENIRKFHQSWFTPNRMVVVGIMSLDQIPAWQDQIEKNFGSLPSPSTEILNLQTTASSKRSIYTGGLSLTDSSNLPAHPNPEHSVLTHVQLAFEGLAANDPDIYALGTLISLLGGGGSFSAGGPGKGMYTRLYTSVLNRHGWIESCYAVHHSYADASLFTLTATVPPSKGAHGHILDVLCDQLFGVMNSITEEELSRAKNQLKSNLLMSLESRLIQAEDIGRQFLSFGQHQDVRVMCERIDRLCVADLQRVTRRLVLNSNEPSPFDFNDPVMKPWTRTGDGRPSLLVWGPLIRNDPLYKADEILKKWGIGQYHQNASSHPGHRFMKRWLN